MNNKEFAAKLYYLLSKEELEGLIKALEERDVGLWAALQVELLTPKGWRRKPLMFFNKSWFWLIVLPGLAMMAIYNFSPDVDRAKDICQVGLIFVAVITFFHGVKYAVEN